MRVDAVGVVHAAAPRGVREVQRGLLGRLELDEPRAKDIGERGVLVRHAPQTLGAVDVAELVDLDILASLDDRDVVRVRAERAARAAEGVLGILIEGHTNAQISKHAQNGSLKSNFHALQIHVPVGGPRHV